MERHKIQGLLSNYRRAAENNYTQARLAGSLGYHQWMQSEGPHRDRISDRVSDFVKAECELCSDFWNFADDAKDLERLPDSDLKCLANVFEAEMGRIALEKGEAEAIEYCNTETLVILGERGWPGYYTTE